MFYETSFDALSSKGMMHVIHISIVFSLKLYFFNIRLPVCNGNYVLIEFFYPSVKLALLKICSLVNNYRPYIFYKKQNKVTHLLPWAPVQGQPPGLALASQGDGRSQSSKEMKCPAASLRGLRKKGILHATPIQIRGHEDAGAPAACHHV